MYFCSLFQFVSALALLATAANGDQLPYAYSQAASTSSVRAAAPEPIAIVRSVNNAAGTPGFEDNFNFEFESENGIKQAAQGEMKTVGDEDVMVMKGSYQYIDADGKDVLVTWYADETGYHAESDILPVAPEIPFEEQRQAVEAQIRFAAEERAAAARAGPQASQDTYVRYVNSF